MPGLCHMIVGLSSPKLNMEELVSGLVIDVGCQPFTLSKWMNPFSPDKSANSQYYVKCGGTGVGFGD